MVKIETLRDLEAMLDIYPAKITYDILGASNSEGEVTFAYFELETMKYTEPVVRFFKDNADRKLADFTIGINSLGLTLGITFESED